jgi:predicted DNA-binding protein YlxM (UPF0122 family)
MFSEEFTMLLNFFKALSDEKRLMLLGLVATREYSVEELAELLQLKPPTVSHHLTRLKETGLVTMRADKNTHFYRLDSTHLQQISKGLLSSETLAELVPRKEIEADAWERKVRRDFFDGPQLKEIPASRKKRTVILRWLATLFEPGIRYSEAQVNELLKAHHPDTATLRRELIGEHLLEREQGIYWRGEGQ